MVQSHEAIAFYYAFLLVPDKSAPLRSRPLHVTTATKLATINTVHASTGG